MNFSYISKRGDVLHLTGNNYFDLLNVDAQTAATADISDVVTGGVDGDTVTNIRAVPRTIIIDLRIKSSVDVEEAKREILKKIKLKQSGVLEWTQNKRTVIINGIVESVDMPRWNNSVTMQITFHCESPFWEDIDEIVQNINQYIDTHYFTDNADEMLYFTPEGISFGYYNIERTRTIFNGGDVAVGLEIHIIALDTVTNPVIYDTVGNFFGVGYGRGSKKVTMQSGDKIIITTGKGNKTVKLNGVNLYDKIRQGSRWLQLETGENQFAINSEDENIDNMYFNIMYRQRYI